MRAEENLINELITNLPDKLGDQYNIEIPSVYNFGPAPDLIIENKKTGFKTLIEFKGNNSEDELPYAIVPSLRKIFVSYNSEKSKFVLVSSSRVSETIKQFLKRDNIELIEMPNKNDFSDKIEKIVVKTE